MNPSNLYASAPNPPAAGPFRAPDAPPPDAPSDVMAMLPPVVRQALQALWRGKWLILLAGLAAGAVTALRVLRLPRSYTSNASFLLQGGGGSSSGASSIASQFGISLGGGEGVGSQAYYAELLHTRELLGRIAQDTFCYPCTSERSGQPLTTILGLQQLDSLRRMDAIVNRLRGAIRVEPSRTGIVRLFTTMESPELAQQLALATLDQLSRFNLEGRQSQAAAERRFTERRLEEVDGELRAAEMQLQGFMQANRVASSPELVIRQGRLQQAVELRRQLYLTLARAYEQAKIDEVRDTPVLTVLDRPSFALRPNGRGLVSRTAFSVVYGALAGAALVLALTFYRDRRRRLA